MGSEALARQTDKVERDPIKFRSDFFPDAVEHNNHDRDPQN